MADGWVKLHRKLLQNPIACKDADYLAVWIYLLLNATHSNRDAWFEKERITLRPGQLITGRKVIANRFGISESKVQRILKSFESEHQIEQQTSNKSRLISMLNWDEYQNGEQQKEQPVNNQRTTSEQPVNTNKNERKKEGKNGRTVDSIHHRYGSYANVLLSDDQYDRLVREFPKNYSEWIERLSEYMASSGKRYKDCLATIRSWARKEKCSKTDRSINNVTEWVMSREEKENG